MALPTLTADAVRRRLAKVGSLGLDGLLFQFRDGTALATAVNTNASIELAAELLGAQAGRAVDAEIVAVPTHGKNESQACVIV